MPVAIKDAWNGWYHVNGHTYGTWLRGDERGWRARHHREHVEGDYKNPPAPAEHRDRLEYSRRVTGDVVHLCARSRELALNVFIETFAQRRVELITLAIDDHHYHLLARFESADASRTPKAARHQPIYALIRHEVGLAKSRSGRALSQAGLRPEGTTWAKRCKITAITDRSHQLEVVRYILDHATRGAATWRVPPAAPPAVDR